MKTPSKPVLIGGGIALALGAIWYIKKSEQSQEEFIPTTGPTTYVGSQEAAGNFGNFGGGGAPSTSVPGVTVTPKPIDTKHRDTGNVSACPPGKRAVGISAVAGQPGGIRCV